MKKKDITEYIINRYSDKVSKKKKIKFAFIEMFICVNFIFIVVSTSYVLTSKLDIIGKLIYIVLLAIYSVGYVFLITNQKK